MGKWRWRMGFQIVEILTHVNYVPEYNYLLPPKPEHSLLVADSPIALLWTRIIPSADLMTCVLGRHPDQCFLLWQHRPGSPQPPHKCPH